MTCSTAPTSRGAPVSARPVGFGRRRTPYPLAPCTQGSQSAISERTPDCARRRGAGVACHATWLECGADADVDVPVSFAYKLWGEKEKIPEWMPIIAYVKVEPDDAALSTWCLRASQFGRDWELVWLARNMAPIKNRKIHWRSVDGSMQGAAGIEVRNRGEIRFAPRADDACSVRLTFTFEVPTPLAPFAAALRPFGDGVLRRDMERFREHAAQRYAAEAEKVA